MKNFLLGLSIATVVICGFLLLEKDRRGATESKFEQGASLGEKSEDRNNPDPFQTEPRFQERVKKTVKTGTAGQFVGGSASGRTEPKNRLLRDPKMRKAIEAEAKEGIEKNIKSLFKAGLAEQLHLDESQSATLYQLLSQKQELFWNKMLLPMMTGEIAEGDMAGAGEAIKAAFEQNKAQLRELLGDNGLSTYEWFEKTEAARDEYKDLNAKLATGGQPLSDQQQQQLYQILTDEHASFKMHYNFEDPSKLNLEDWYDNFTEDKLEVCDQDIEALNERMLQRAQAILTPDQLDMLRELLAEKSLKAKFVVMTTSAMMAKQR